MLYTATPCDANKVRLVRKSRKNEKAFLPPHK